MAKGNGVDRLKARFKAIPKRVVEAVKPALEASGKELVAGMKAIAPRDTGDLAGSVVMTKGGQRTPPYSMPGGTLVVPENAVAVTVGNTDVRYPHLVEYGSVNGPAQPFFWPVVRSKRKAIANRIKRAVRKGVRS